MPRLRKWLIAIGIAVSAVAGTAAAFAQGGGPEPSQDSTIEQKFIGDPPGNDQTGEWDGDYEYEG